MPEDISMLIFFTNNFSVIEKENFQNVLIWGEKMVSHVHVLLYI